MQPNLKQYADYFAIGLLLDICLVTEIITWVDQLIESSDRPFEWMIEISTSANKHPLDIIHLLNFVPGTTDWEVSLRLVIAKLDKVHPTLLSDQKRFIHSKYWQLFSKLYSFIQEHKSLSDEVMRGIFQIYIYLDCIEAGYGNLSTIQQDYQELLNAGSNYKQWIAL
jgi:hypothetical protein